MKPNKNIINIFGPTASGKTGLSIELAKYLLVNGFKAEVINFDSLVFYKELNIGTAKPSIEEMGNIPHHFVGTQSIKNPINSSDFIQLAKPLVNSLLNKNVIPILVGGSGFYLRALLKGMYSSEPNKKMSEKQLSLFTDLLQKNNKDDNRVLIEFLKINDPESLDNIHQNDFYRLSRAAEYFILNKKKLSTQKKDLDEKSPYNFAENLQINAQPLNFYLLPEKQQHLQIILERTRLMVQSGLIEEVRKLLDEGFDKELKPLGSIGYKETINFIEQGHNNTDLLIEDINISTRQLAKAQKTFFKKVEPKITLDPLASTITNIEKIFSQLS